MKQLLADANPFHRARAVWLLARARSGRRREVERLLADPDPQIRITAFRALRKVKPSVLAEARRLATDPSPAVRREVALSLRGVPFEQARDILLTLAAGYDGADRWYLEALGTAASGDEEALYSALLPSLCRGRDPIAWDARFAAIAWRLHPAAAIDAFAARAASRGALGRRATAGAGRARLHQRSARRAGDGRSDAQRASGCRRAGGVVDDLPEDQRLARYPVDGWVADAPRGDAGLARRHAGAPRASCSTTRAPIDRRIEAALAMASDAAGGAAAPPARGREQGRVSRCARPLGSVIFSNPDRSVRSAAAGFFPRPGGPPRMTVADVAGRAGDAARGETRFTARLFDVPPRAARPRGADVGPELTDIDKKFDRAGLVEAIVNPNAAIAFGYGAELFVTRRSEPHIGFLLADGPTVSIRDGYGRRGPSPREDLDTRSAEVEPDAGSAGAGADRAGRGRHRGVSA